MISTTKRKSSQSLLTLSAQSTSQAGNKSMAECNVHPNAIVCSTPAALHTLSICSCCHPACLPLTIPSLLIPMPLCCDQQMPGPCCLVHPLLDALQRGQHKLGMLSTTTAGEGSRQVLMDEGRQLVSKHSFLTLIHSKRFVLA